MPVHGDLRARCHGAVAADLTIPYTGAPDISKIVTLSGTGVQAQIVFSPTTGLNFSTPVGDTSPSQALTIRNAGTTFTTISGITLAGAGAAQFAIASTTCGATLSAGQVHRQRDPQPDRPRHLDGDRARG